MLKFSIIHKQGTNFNTFVTHLNSAISLIVHCSLEQKPFRLLQHEQRSIYLCAIWCISHVYIWCMVGESIFLTSAIRRKLTFQVKNGLHQNFILKVFFKYYFQIKFRHAYTRFKTLLQMFSPKEKKIIIIYTIIYI